jgi:hypothetical protein
MARFLTPIAVVFALVQAGGRLLLDHFGGRPVVWLDLIALAGFQGVAGFFLGYVLWLFNERQWRKANDRRASATESPL